MPLHESVLLEEVLQWIGPVEDKLIVDGTVGAGGHSRAILERMGPRGRLVGLDKDARALRCAKEALEPWGDRVMLLNEDFRNMAETLKDLGDQRAQAVLLDLGVSSMQLDDPARGFSFMQDGPLDMRMNPTTGKSAKDLVNTWREEDLRQIFWDLGEERFGRRIASRIVESRKKRPFETTRDLAQVIEEAVPAFYRHGRLHPATRTFQALRIAVNGELEALRVFLASALDCLQSGGRLLIISFHSLEDRQVKVAFKQWAMGERGKILTKKPVICSEEEKHRNARSRSAKLRVFERF